MSASRHRVYEWSLPSGETLKLRANLADAGAPIHYEAEGCWHALPYRSGNALHRPREALRLALTYFGPDYYRDPTDDRSDDEILNDIVEAAEAVEDDE